MVRWFAVLLVGLLILASPTGVSAAEPPRGLGSPPQGLGAPGGLATVNPKAIAFEDDLLGKINAQRAKQKLPPLTMDMRLRGFARSESALAAHGDPTAAQIHDRIQQKGLAPYGYYVQSLFGPDAQQIFRALVADKAMKAALFGEFANAGIGAFFVPEEPPYFQVTILVTKDADPMAGKTGLSKAETDPVMKSVMPGVKACYDEALKKNPNVRGDLLVKIVIGGDGRPTEASPLRTLGNLDLEVCVLGLVKGLRFPQPYKGTPVTLNHPFTFEPPQGSTVVGQLSKDEIEATFGRASFQLTECYEKRLEKKKALRGSVVIGLTVEPDGKVTKLRLVSDDMQDLSLNRCILERAQELGFPRPKFGGAVDIEYPLHFEPPVAKK